MTFLQILVWKQEKSCFEVVKVDMLLYDLRSFRWLIL